MGLHPYRSPSKGRFQSGIVPMILGMPLNSLRIAKQKMRMKTRRRGESRGEEADRVMSWVSLANEAGKVPTISHPAIFLNHNIAKR